MGLPLFVKSGSERASVDGHWRKGSSGEEVEGCLDWSGRSRTEGGAVVRVVQQTVRLIDRYCPTHPTRRCRRCPGERDTLIRDFDGDMLEIKVLPMSLLHVVLWRGKEVGAMRGRDRLTVRLG